MAVIYLRIQEGGYKYGKYLVTTDLVLNYDTFTELGKCELITNEVVTPSRSKIKYKINGIFLHFLLQELINCNYYRISFIKYHIFNFVRNVILFDLQATSNQIVDHKWNERISYLVREKCELEHALSWLSTLGGAFSALGDYFGNFALVAGKISYHQLVLAIRMGDPTIASRCKLYFSLSLIQRRKFKLAQQIIRTEYDSVKNSVTIDPRLVSMCLGIWSKLQYEHKVYQEAKKRKRFLSGLRLSKLK